MKKLIVLTFLFSCCLTMLSAQNWLLYDASTLPSETGGEPLDLTSLSQDSPGENMVEEIIDDPDIPGNKILRYLQPDELSSDGSSDANKMYRYFFEDENGPWTGSQLTIVARVKGVDNWEELGLDRVFDIQYRNGNDNTRDELRLNYAAPSIELDRSDATAPFEAGYNDWHVFRIAVDGATSSVYVDENPVPVVTGTSTATTGDVYLKIGDGSSDKVGGLLDWIAVDVTGAYSPIESPLDERFTGAPTAFDPGNYRIAFLTKETKEDGTLEDAELVSDLRQRGFQVDVTYNNAAEITYTPDFEFSYEALEDYDLVIIGRAVSSGDFTDAEGWAAVETPVMILSAYLVRSSRLKLLNTSSASREVPDATTVAEDRVTNVQIEAPEHPVFTGLDEDGNGEIGYHKWFYDYNGATFETFAQDNSGTLLASLSAEDMPGDSSVYVAVWDANTVPYTDAGVTFAGPRAYFQMGSDDNSSPKIKNFFAFTEESTLLFHNLIKYLLDETPDGVVIDASGPVAMYTMEGTGEQVDDVIGSADGTILNGNGVTRVSCGVNNAIDFSGSTKPEAVIWVEDKPSINFDSTQSFSIALLAKVDPHTNVAEMNFLLKGDNTSNGTHLPNGNGHWYSVATKDNELRFAIDDNVTKTQLGVAIDETNFPAGEWNHIVAVRDLAQDSLFLYLNGEKVGAILDETEEDISTPNLPLVIGNYHSGIRKVNGGLDEIALFDYALTAERISEMYTATTTTNECTVVETITEASNDATLSGLTVSAGTLDPAFDPDITSYKLELPEGTTSVTISATANDAAATVSGDGEFTDIPGTAVVTVTAEDGTVKDYNINVSIEGAGNARIVVEPGFETLFLAIQAANDGDTLVLQNGEVYTPLESYQINKKIVIIAEEIPTLPGLENMPIIENLFAVSPLFKLNFGADLHLIGIDVDGQGAPNLFDARGDAGVSSTLAVLINRCRLHNTTEDIFNDARDGGGDNTILTSMVVRNSFVYDSGPGHGLYIKNYAGSNPPYIFENITYWNIGQQFNWIRHYGVDDEQQFIYNHMTGYNLSTSEADNKELFGNADDAAGATLDIDLKNSILSNQVSTNDGSLIFNNTSERHSITINNNVLYQVQPIVNQGGTITEQNNMIGVDPQFQDPDNGDFTVLNASLYNAADDGLIVGAVYWHPDFVDDFSDFTTGTKEVVVPAMDFALQNAPNPFDNNTVISFTIKDADEVHLRIFDVTGKLVKMWKGKLTVGRQSLQVNTQDMKPGMYIYQITSNGATAASKMIKN